MGKGTASLILGMIGFLLAVPVIVNRFIIIGVPITVLITSIVAIIIGVIGVIAEMEIERYLSIAGLVLGTIAFIIGLIVFGLRLFW